MLHKSKTREEMHHSHTNKKKAQENKGLKLQHPRSKTVQCPAQTYQKRLQHFTFELKRAVDFCLKNIPDEPQLPNYTIYRRAPTDSLIDMMGFKSNQSTEGCLIHLGTDTTGRRDCHNTVA